MEAQVRTNYLIFLAIIIQFLLATNAVAMDNVRILLNSPLLFDKPTDTCESEICLPLLKAIKSAKESIDFAIYGMRNQTVLLNAIKKAKNRGVNVRGVVDSDIDGNNYYASTAKLVKTIGNIKTDQAADINTLKNKKQWNYKPYCKRPKGFDGPLQCVGYSIPKNKCIVASMASREKFESKGGDIMHNKFFIIDNKIVWTGSTNISDSGTGGYNANIALLIENTKFASFYTQEFEQMYHQMLFHKNKKLFKNKVLRTQVAGSDIKVSFSPQGSTMEKMIRPLIQQSTSYIDVPIFFLTHKKITADLIRAHQRGVKIRVIIDATAAKNGYTKHKILQAAGIPVKVENWGGKMHMKVAVIDGQYLVIGSMNWTTAGEKKNDENTVVINNVQNAQKVHRFFESLWDSIPDQWLNARPDPESIESTNACYDNVDNDFDNLIDNQDRGCQKNPAPLKKLPPYWIVAKAEGNNLIKGNISRTGEKIYHVPNGVFYKKTKIVIENGEKWFCSTYDAKENGWRASKK